MPLDENAMEDILVRLQDAMLKYRNEYYAPQEFGRSGRDHTIGQVMFCRKADPDPRFKSGVAIHNMTGKRGDLSNHQRLHHDDCVSELIGLCEELSELVAQIPLYNHPKLTVAVTFHHRKKGGNGIQVIIDGIDPHGSALTIPSITKRLAQKLNSIENLKAEGPFKCYFINAKSYIAPTAALALMKYAAIMAHYLLDTTERRSMPSVTERMRPDDVFREFQSLQTQICNTQNTSSEGQS